MLVWYHSTITNHTFFTDSYLDVNLQNFIRARLRPKFLFFQKQICEGGASAPEPPPDWLPAYATIPDMG